MSLDIDTEDPVSQAANFSSRLEALLNRLSVRTVVLIGIVLFFAAVSVDSLQQALAADMGNKPLRAIALSANVETATAEAGSPASLVGRDYPESYLTFDAGTASRLSRSDLTSAHLTRSRLTSAHFFTRQVSPQ